MKQLKRYLTVGALSAIVMSPVMAEDIEVYVGNESFRQGKNAKVLIIFDNSGSMLTQETVKKPFDPSKTYAGSNGFSSDAIYISRSSDRNNGAVPKVHNEDARFHKALLGCETAWEKLRTVGFYTGYLREYQVKGSFGSWEQLPLTMGINTTNPIDCYDDIVKENRNNGVYGPASGRLTIPDDRYPINGTGNAKTDLINTAYTKNKTLALSQSSAFQGGEPVTLYTANYINYFNATDAAIGTTKKTRLDIAKETINTLLTATPGVDFGLQIFNLNWSKDGERDGGRIISGIKTMTDTARSNLLSTLSNISANTNTPLCESLMEAKRYYGGEAVTYGIADRDESRLNYVADRPKRDLSIETGNRYITPYDTCSDVIYTILITDGTPTVDNHADAAIRGLSSTAPFVVNSNTNTVSYLPVLAEWMFKNDINPDLPGTQNARLYTIGFGQDAVNNAGQLLTKAAELGGGKYFAASNPVALAAALQGTLSDILKISTTFTAPSVATNNFDRTRSLDNVYYAMFLPDAGTRWSGNLKKLKFVGDKLVDKNGVAALDGSGSIADTAVTFWADSNVADGNKVAEGGAAAQLRKQEQRKFLVNIGTELKSLARASFSSQVLESLLGADVQEQDKYIQWARGIDIDDDNNNNNRTETRQDVMGDPLHSTPLVLTYSAQDTRIIVGTNHGFLHMFKDSGDTVEESWAFMPQELVKNIPELRRNQNGNPKIYGVDGVPISHFQDGNGDGVVNGSDKVWMFFGLRRGGNSYYGMDLSSPDNPKLMWRIDNNTPGFAELAQSWSTPVVTYIKANGIDKPVLVFGAGFSSNKDSRGLVSEDNEGRGVFIVDAQSGALIKAIGSESGVKHSVAADVALLDSDADGFTDRLYFSDTGGNIWRTDMVGSNVGEWTTFKFANVSGTTASESRRFFNKPTIARVEMREVKDVITTVDGDTTTYVTKVNVPYDAIVIGSGSRPHPLYNGTNDMFFMLKDMNVVTQAFTVDNAPQPITVSDLYQITDVNPRETKEQLEELQRDIAARKGWFYPLSASEKSLSSAVVLSGVAFFTSYIPTVERDEERCSLSAGEGKIYAFNLYGILIKTFTTETIPPTPKPIVRCMENCDEPDSTDDVIILIPSPTDIPCDGENCPPPHCEGEDCPPPCEGDECPPKKGGANKLIRSYILIEEN